MSKDEEELDPRETPAHPRFRENLIGHDQVEKKLLEAYSSGRFHHAWMLCGPAGIGKATLAYRLARFILSNPDFQSLQGQAVGSLAVSSESLVVQRIAARAHSDLFILQRELNPKTEKLRPAISVDDARRLTRFFTKTAGEGGWRICIIDAGDDLNIAAANAILKSLEEPPKKCLFIIVANAPGRLLATIRSRCLRLDMTPLDDSQVKAVVSQGLLEPGLGEEEVSGLIELGAGSPGKVLQLATSQGARQFIRFKTMIGGPQGFTMASQITVAEEFQKRGFEIEFNIFGDLLSSWIGLQANAAGEQSKTQRANAFATCHSEFSNSLKQTNALNLDRRQTLMMAFEAIEKILAHK